MRLKLAALVAAAVLVVASDAAADGPVRIGSAAVCRTEAGSTLTLAPGAVIVPAARWEAGDAEIRRLQDAETRLAAENRKLRALADDAGPGWGTALAAALSVAGGFALGIYVAH